MYGLGLFIVVLTMFNIFNRTLHAGLANPTCLQSLMVWYCSVCELRESNSDEEFWYLRHFLFNTFPMYLVYLFLFGQWLGYQGKSAVP